MASPAEIGELVVRVADEELHRALVRYVARAEAAGLLDTHPTLVATALVERLEKRTPRPVPRILYREGEWRGESRWPDAGRVRGVR